MLRRIDSERTLLTPKTKIKTTGSTGHTGTSLAGYQTTYSVRCPHPTAAFDSLLAGLFN
jgi:hypothetical protein